MGEPGDNKDAVADALRSAGNAGEGGGVGAESLPAPPRRKRGGRGKSRARRVRRSPASVGAGAAGEGASAREASPADAKAIADAALSAQGGDDDLGAGAGDGGAGGGGDRVFDAEPDLSTSIEELAEFCEFALWGILQIVPATFGGGELTDKESKMLGRMWSKALYPYLRSKDTPVIIAFAVTAEILLKRAVIARVTARPAPGGEDAQG